MKRILWSSLGLLLMLIFLFGTTGISFYIHDCKSSNNKEVFIYPEILNHQSSCCCADEVNGKTSGDPLLQFNDPDCCKNTHLYFKADFRGFPVFYSSPVTLSGLLHPFIPGETISLFVQFEEPVTFCGIDHPPPLSGKLLVYFIQQIKIPTSVS